jgi:hypothetical protein
MNGISDYLEKWVEINGEPRPYEPPTWTRPRKRTNWTQVYFDTTSTSDLRRLFKSYSEHAELWIRRDGKFFCSVTVKQIRNEIWRREQVSAQRQWRAMIAKPEPRAIPKTLEVAMIMKLLRGLSAKQLVGLLR